MIKHNITSLAAVICLGLLTLGGCKTQMLEQQLADAEFNSLQLNSEIEADPAIEAMIKPYRDQMGVEMNQVVGNLPVTIKKQRPNSNMGNWFADLLEEASKGVFPDDKIDFAVQNYGGLRLASLAEGPITKGDIFELMPFDNTLMLIKMSAEEVQTLLNRIAEYGGWPISKSLSFTIEGSVAVDAMINGKPLGSKKDYRVSMPDYIANGGDDCPFLVELPREDSGLFIRQIVIEYLADAMKNQVEIEISDDKRIKK